MKRLRIAALTAAMLTFPATLAQAGVIERACNGSDRESASQALCGCLQDVADLTLSGTEQRLAASFFRNPQKAQDIRQSERATNERFWQRYKNFGETAEAFCAS